MSPTFVSTSLTCTLMTFHRLHLPGSAVLDSQWRSCALSSWPSAWDFTPSHRHHGCHLPSALKAGGGHGPPTPIPNKHPPARHPPASPGLTLVTKGRTFPKLCECVLRR